MLKLNKHTKTKPKPTLVFTKCSRVCEHHYAQLSYTTQHRTVVMIFPYLPDNIIAQTVSSGSFANVTTVTALDRAVRSLFTVNMYIVHCWRPLENEIKL